MPAQANPLFHSASKAHFVAPPKTASFHLIEGSDEPSLEEEVDSPRIAEGTP